MDDLDDLDVIRLVAMDNISKRSITREKGEVKENFRMEAEVLQAVYLASLQVFP
jgi:hypothetical protein